jgi:dienelactone hydrolase
MRLANSVVLTVGLLALAAGAAAQSFADVVGQMARTAPDLKLPEAARTWAREPLEMSIFKPDGDGPFPALVIAHSCGGLRPEIMDWARLAHERGYVTFVLDSLGPRGLGPQQGCDPAGPVNGVRGAKDALQALRHLRTLPYVDGRRIGLLGFSRGAMAAMLAHSPAYADVLSAGERFAAVVGFYPLCFIPPGPGRRSVDFVRPDYDRPLLALLGGRDHEAPPQDCVTRLQALRDKGAPVAWHVYPEAGHCWDCTSMDGHSKVDFLGSRVTYRYDRALTMDAAERTFRFLDEHLKKP